VNKQTIRMVRPGHLPGSGGESPESAREAELRTRCIQSIVIGNSGYRSAAQADCQSQLADGGPDVHAADAAGGAEQ
jgi:hypothetical protein